MFWLLFVSVSQCIKFLPIPMRFIPTSNKDVIILYLIELFGVAISQALQGIFVLLIKTF